MKAQILAGGYAARRSGAFGSIGLNPRNQSRNRDVRNLLRREAAHKRLDSARRVGWPILLAYGYQQSFRWRPYWATSEYLAYIQKILQFALREVKTDFIHFDNFDLNTETGTCHGNACGNGFRARPRNKYTAAQRKERLGSEIVDHVNPPLWNSDNPHSRLKMISAPVLQEWVDFRCQVMTDVLAKMAV